MTIDPEANHEAFFALYDSLPPNARAPMMASLLGSLAAHIDSETWQRLAQKAYDKVADAVWDGRDPFHPNVTD